MVRKRDRRFPVNLPIVKEIRLSLWGHTRGVSKTRMAEAILIDRVSNADNWSEVCKDLQQEAAIRKVPVEELIKEILKADGYEESIDVEGVDWLCLLDNKEPEIEQEEEESWALANMRIHTQCFSKHTDPWESIYAQVIFFCNFVSYSVVAASSFCLE